MARIVSSTS